MMHNYRSIPKKQGLYDPAHEHDACGVGFVVNIKGERSHDIVVKATAGARQPDASRRMRMRSAHGRRRRNPAADSARVFRERSGAARIQTARGGRIRRRPGLPAARRGEAQGLRGRIRENRQRGRAANPRMARRAGGGIRVRRYRAARDARDPPGLHRVQSGSKGRRGDRAQAVRDSQARDDRSGETRAFRSRTILFLQPLGADRRLQGSVDLDAVARVLSRSTERRVQVRARDGASALLDQHLPKLGPRASVPLHVAQRRDQHAARQYQLDGRARETVFVAAVRRRHQEAAADRRAQWQRLGDFRQLSRAADSHRPFDPARRDDDDSGSVAERSADERQQARVLRFSFVHDGAVGRPRVDRVHRRNQDRRGARSQRPAPVALHGDQRRAGRDGVGDRRARHRAGERRAQRALAAGQNVSHRYRARQNRAGRRDQGVDSGATAVSQMARQQPRHTRVASGSERRAGG